MYGQTEEDIKKRHDAGVKRYQAFVENDYGLHHFSYSQSPEAIKKRSETSAKRAKNMGKDRLAKASLAAIVTKGHANWSPYNHNENRVDPVAELQALAANPRFQGILKSGPNAGKPGVNWKAIQNSDVCIYLNDGNDKRGGKATFFTCPM